MDEVTCFIGIDVSKTRLDVHILPQATSLVVDNDARGLEDLAARLAPYGSCLVVLEATGGLQERAAAVLAAGSFGRARGAGFVRSPGIGSERVNGSARSQRAPPP